MSKRLFWLIVLACVLSAGLIAYLAPVSQHTLTRSAAATIAPADDAWRAALPHDPTAATQAYMARLSGAATTRSNAYFEGGYWLQLWNFGLTLLSIWLILRSGVLASLRARMEQRQRSRWLINLGMFASFLLLMTLLGLPLEVYQDFYREHSYGLANQHFADWLVEALMAHAINLFTLSLLLLILYAAIRRLNRNWWIWGSLIGFCFLSFFMLISPVYIDPLFNTYKPLADGEVRQSILSLARANGVPADNVYQFDASRQSNRVSANVSGIFGSAAIRLNDNLLKRCSLAEIKAVTGHEIGHYVLSHIYQFLLAITLILALGLWFVQKGMIWSIRRWGSELGVRDQADPLGLPIFAALFTIYMFVMTPVVNTVIRTQENQADMYGLNTAAEPDGFAEAGLKLTEYRKPDPGELEEILFYDHPSPRKRIFAAMRWKAEHSK